MASDPQTKKNILLVEDEEAIANPLIKLLNIRGYHTNWVQDGVEALEHLKERNDYKCLLVDIMMPKMDGWDLADSLKASEKLKQLPFIFLSADNRSEKEAKRRSEVFVSKPINLTELVEKIESLCNA